jgi:predicted O-methyltransferase YrrM
VNQPGHWPGHRVNYPQQTQSVPRTGQSAADFIHGTDSEARFLDAVQRLYVPSMGTEVVAPLLSQLIHLVRPERVLEVGMGYTTPFLARALAQVAEVVRVERQALAAKTQPYFDADSALDNDWLFTEPALLSPTYYRSQYQPRLVAIDAMEGQDTSAPQVSAVLAELGLKDLVTVVNAELRSCVNRLPTDFLPVDFAWVDVWDCLYFFEHFMDLINPDGGLVVMHYLMTYPEGEAILDYIAQAQQSRPGEFEVLNMLESQKLSQNSVTILRRTRAADPKLYAEVGQRFRLDGKLRDDAAALISLTADDEEMPTPQEPSAHTPPEGAVSS